MHKTIEELKQMPVWLLWRKRSRNGKVAKVPFAADGSACGTNDDYQGSWVTYDEAQQAAKQQKADGVGFVIPKGMFFLDIDHRDLNDPMVQEVLALLHSYSEFSVSGAGIHIYGLCDVAQLPTWVDPKDGKRKLAKEYYTHHPDNGLELYVGELTNRFAAFTGKVIQDGPLVDCTSALVDILNHYMKKPAVQSALDKKAEKVIQELRAQKNGVKFSRIFDDGQWEEYGSQSQVDTAMCAIIAFRAGEDTELIDAVFRRSALYREKWEREDYRNMTIEKGIELSRRRSNKEPSSQKQPKKKRPDFIKVDEKKRESVSAPLLAKYVRENLPYLLVRDSGNQAIMKYVYQDGVYKLFDLNMLHGVVKQYIADYNEELVKMNVVKEAVQLILSDLDYLSQDDLNTDEDVINFQNGLLRVSGSSVTLLPHSPNVRSTIQIPCNWTEKEVPTPVFDSYLDTLTNGDAAVKQLLLQFMGVAISNIRGWRTKKALFLVGDGNTGKSQLKSLTERLLGKGNYIGMDLSEIEARFGTGAVYGKRLAGSSDMSFLSVDELRIFKKLTGSDSVYAEFKGQQPFEYVYNGLLWFCMNRLPKFSGDQGRWVYNRIMVVQCPNVIPPEQQDKRLLDKMYAEREGIVQKCVKALQTVIANGYTFSEPESVIAARAQYQATNSTVISFFEECMCHWPDGKIGGSCITTGAIHKAYIQWCKANNNGYARSAKEFRDELAMHLGTTFADMTTRIHGNTYYKEWTLTSDTQDDFKYIL